MAVGGPLVQDPLAGDGGVPGRPRPGQRQRSQAGQATPCRRSGRGARRRPRPRARSRAADRPAGLCATRRRMPRRPQPAGAAARVRRTAVPTRPRQRPADEEGPAEDGPLPQPLRTHLDTAVSNCQRSATNVRAARHRLCRSPVSSPPSARERAIQSPRRPLVGRSRSCRCGGPALRWVGRRGGRRLLPHAPRRRRALRVASPGGGMRTGAPARHPRARGDRRSRLADGRARPVIQPTRRRHRCGRRAA